MHHRSGGFLTCLFATNVPSRTFPFNLISYFPEMVFCGLSGASIQTLPPAMLSHLPSGRHPSG